MAKSMGVPLEESGDSKLAWLRSQIIGNDAAFDSPFGRRRLTYTDHTASGRCIRYVEDFITNNVLPFYGNTYTSDSYVGRRSSKMVREARDYIKKCLGGKPNDVLLFCESSTTGAIKRLQEVMGVMVPSTLRSKFVDILPVEERWAVFVGPYEHHSNILSWRQSLAEVIDIGINNEGTIDMEELRGKLTIYRNANRPILGTFSACSNVTGKLTDTRALAKLLHEFEGFACFDFAASGPYAVIDMKSGEIDGYDAVVLSPHKFPGGPGSPGILLMSKALYCLESSPPSTCGGGTVNYVNGFDEKVIADGQILAVCAAPYGHILLGMNKMQSLAIRSAIQKGYHGVKLGWTRISFPYYMSEEEFHFILDALAFVADYGQRFLPLYKLDIRKGGWTFKRKTLADLLSKSPPTLAENTKVQHDDNRAKILTHEYASYLEQALRIAGVLPEFPRPSNIGEGMMDLDDELIYFRT